MSSTKFQQGNRVALVSDTSYRGTIYSVIHPYNLGDPEAYNVQWDKQHSVYLYFGEMLILERQLEKEKAK